MNWCQHNNYHNSGTLYIVLQNLPLTLLDEEGKVTLEQVMITYRDITLFFLNSLLNMGEFPVQHTGHFTPKKGMGCAL